MAVKIDIGSGREWDGTLALPVGGASSSLQSAIQAPVAPASATATKGVLIAAQYNSAGVTFTDGQQGVLPCSAKGALYVSGATASGATDAGNPVKVGGVYNTTLPTLTTGQRGDGQLDTRGSFHVTIMGVEQTVGASVAAAPTDAVTNNSAGLQAYARIQIYNGATWDKLRSSAGAPSAAGVGILAVEEAGRSFSHIATNTTTAVKSGAGFLHSITINTKGASSNIATVYDNTAGSGTVIAIIDTTDGRETLLYDLAFATGLTIVTATGTAADMTVTYR